MKKLTKQQNATLERIHNQYKANQAIADRIIKAVEAKNGHIFIGVSAEGLRFYQMDKAAREVLNTQGLN